MVGLLVAVSTLCFAAQEENPNSWTHRPKIAANMWITGAFGGYAEHHYYGIATPVTAGGVVHGIVEVARLPGQWPDPWVDVWSESSYFRHGGSVHYYEGRYHFYARSKKNLVVDILRRSSFGRYKFRVRFLGKPDDHSDTFGYRPTMLFVTRGIDEAGSFDYAGDFDCFQIRRPEIPNDGKRYRLVVETVGLSSDADTVLRLYDLGNSRISSPAHVEKFSDDVDGGTGSRIVLDMNVYSLDSDRTWFHFIVTHKDPKAISGSYRLRARLEAE